MKIFFLLLLLCLSACGSQGEEITATLAVYAPEGAVLSETSIAFQEGETVFAILQREMRERGIPMSFRGLGAAVYVEGIDNLFEFDQGPESGWIYTVNGVEITVSSGMFRPEEGDSIRWYYIINQQ